jgi:hypothetical protein
LGPPAGEELVEILYDRSSPLFCNRFVTIVQLIREVSRRGKSALSEPELIAEIREKEQEIQNLDPDRFHHMVLK